MWMKYHENSHVECIVYTYRNGGDDTDLSYSANEHLFKINE